MASARSGPLLGRVALVTGCGKPDGIGRATAQALLSAGASVVATDVSSGGVANVHLSVADAPATSDLYAFLERARKDAQPLAVATGDVSLEVDAHALVRYTVETFGRLDILVNNAAAPHGGEHGDIEQVDASEWDRVMAVNARGTFLMCRAALPHMRRQRWGRIINMSSRAGRVGIAGQAIYSASKAAVIGLTRSLSQDVLNEGITVNAICPGAVATSRKRPGHGGGRRATPECIADIVVFLASDGARNINGHAMAADGGQSAC